MAATVSAIWSINLLVPTVAFSSASFFLCEAMTDSNTTLGCWRAARGVFKEAVRAASAELAETWDSISELEGGRDGAPPAMVAAVTAQACATQA